MKIIKTLSLWILFFYVFSIVKAQNPCAEIHRLIVTKFGFGEEIQLAIDRMLEGRSEAEIKAIRDKIAKLPNVSFWDLNIFLKFRVLPTKDIIDIFDVLINQSYDSLMQKAFSSNEKLSIAEKRALLLMLNQRWKTLRKIQQTKGISEWFAQLSLRQILEKYYKNKGVIIGESQLEDLIKDTGIVSFTKRALLRYRLLADITNMLLESNSFNIDIMTKHLESRASTLKDLSQKSHGLWKMYNEYQYEQVQILLRLLHTAKEKWKQEYLEYIRTTQNRALKWFLNLCTETQRSFENIAGKAFILGVVAIALGYGSFVIIDEDEEYPMPPIPEDIRDMFNVPTNPHLLKEQSIEHKIDELMQKLNNNQITEKEYREELQKLIYEEIK